MKRLKSRNPDGVKQLRPIRSVFADQMDEMQQGNSYYHVWFSL